MPHPPRLLTHLGRTLPLSEWVALTGRDARTICSRIDRLGWSVADALDTPARREYRPSEPRSAPGRPRRPPAYPKRPHASGQAVVREHGRCVYLGRHGTPASYARYEGLLRRWRPDAAPPTPAGPAPVTVLRLAAAYLAHAEGEYTKGGRPTSEPGCLKLALRALCRLRGEADAAAFGPADLEAVRADLAGRYVRTSANAHLWRLKAAWRWAAARGLVPAATYHALLAVRGLRRGKGRDNPPRRPADLGHVRAAQAQLSGPARALVELQLLTGVRPGEAVTLRAEDLERSGPEWLYRVAGDVNKNEHRDRPQTYWLGPRAQALLAPFLAAAEAGAYLFRPPRARGRGRYTTATYRNRVASACRRAGVPVWVPHQLRHNKATEVRAGYGAEAAAEAIGDTLPMAAVYGERSEALRRKVARETG